MTPPKTGEPLNMFVLKPEYCFEPFQQSKTSSLFPVNQDENLKTQVDSQINRTRTKSMMNAIELQSLLNLSDKNDPSQYISQPQLSDNYEDDMNPFLQQSHSFHTQYFTNLRRCKGMSTSGLKQTNKLNCKLTQQKSEVQSLIASKPNNPRRYDA